MHSSLSQNNRKWSWPLVGAIVCLIVGYVSSFGGGYHLGGLMHKNSSSSRVPIRVPSQRGASTVQPGSEFVPGGYYLEDTIIAITQKEPRRALVASVGRRELQDGYSQGTRTSYYDGNAWSRVTHVQQGQGSAIVSNDIVRRWDISVDDTKVLRQRVDATIVVDEHEIAVDTGQLRNEMPVRSLPGYTKFLSSSTGTITIGTQAEPAHILYERIYSLNADEIQFFDKPIGLTTDWLIFWAADGSVYHGDRTQVDRPTPIYQTHEVALWESAGGAVTTTFSLALSRDKQMPPIAYRIGLGAPINKTVSLRRVNNLDKDPGGQIDWHMGLVEGEVTTPGQTQGVKGVGLVEYIADSRATGAPDP